MRFARQHTGRRKGVQQPCSKAVGALNLASQKRGGVDEPRTRARVSFPILTRSLTHCRNGSAVTNTKCKRRGGPPSPSIILTVRQSITRYMTFWRLCHHDPSNLCGKVVGR